MEINFPTEGFPQEVKALVPGQTAKIDFRVKKSTPRKPQEHPRF